MNKLYKYLIVLTAILGFYKSQAQIEVHAVLDSSKIRIGEQTRLDLYINYDAAQQKSLEILWPTIEDTIIKQIEVVQTTKIDTMFPDKGRPNFIQQRIQLTITSFDSGAYVIPPFKFIINKDTAHPLVTEPLIIQVGSVAVDTSLAKIKDIKPPYDEPFDWRWYLPYAYWGLAILAAVLILSRVIKKLNKKKPAEEVVIDTTPKIPPHVIALETLEKIKQEAIWKDNRIKEYYSDIADTLRLYIEERFKIPALELTSDEILQIFRTQVVDAESKARLVQILTLSDFVKFAKEIPVEAEHTLTLNNAFDFVKGTLREDPLTTINPEKEGA